MGYFPNNTSAEGYKNKYCERCVHDPDCPVLDLHELWNYEIDPIKEEALEVFIPRKGYGNDQCRMFFCTKQKK